MKTALFVMFPVPSHYNICFGLADKLRKQGYKVVFAGTQHVQTHIEEQGFEYTELYYTREVIVKNWQIALGIFIGSLIEKRFLQARYRDFLISASAIYNLCQLHKPDNIYIDEHLNFYYLLLSPFYSNCALVNTKLPTQYISGIPPLTCSIPFKNNIYYKTFAWVLWKKYVIKRKIDYLPKWISVLGNDENFFLKRFLSKYNINVKNYINYNNLLHNGLLDVPIIHLVPRNLEYSWYKMRQNESFFYEPYTRKDVLDNSSFWSSIEPILELRKKGDIKIVYTSLGTLCEDNSQKTINFLKNLITAFEGLPNIHLVLAHKYNIAELEKNLFNVHIFEWIPQTDFLQNCDLMVTHGGTNSVLECVKLGVPMLAYPLNLSADHPGNAARIVVNGWGWKGRMRKENSKKIKQKITKLLSNN